MTPQANAKYVCKINALSTKISVYIGKKKHEETITSASSSLEAKSAVKTTKCLVRTSGSLTLKLLIFEFRKI